MDAEGVVIASVAVIWGVILFVTRPQILEFSREGGKGLRDRKVINACGDNRGGRPYRGGDRDRSFQRM